MKRPFPSWLETAVFYQIYPQSFSDSDGDGIGDLPGILGKLDYLESLGVNALWLNPCFESPFGDAGYDVSDYCRVAPRYGTNADLEALFREAGRRGIRVLLDLVAGHTSVEHPWFRASCRAGRNEHTDWYIWTDDVWARQAEGLDLIRGYGERGGSYATNFFWFQPALNYGFADPDPACPWQQPVDAPGPRAVRAALRGVMRFWLDRGASGFRVDMAPSLVKGDRGHRETRSLWREVRAWLDRDYPDACLLAEWSFPELAIDAGFHLDFYLHFRVRGYTALFRKSRPRNLGSDGYGFSFFDRSGHGNIREFLDEYLRHYAKTRDLGCMSLPTGNHDVVPRLSLGRDADDLELAFLFLLTMPGVPFIYYGDEIGLRTAEGLPSKEGGYERTSVRTPMQWHSTANAGFSSAPAERLYLPIDPREDRPSVEAEERDPRSLLNRVRRMIALRKAHRALAALGGFEPLHAEAGRYPFVYRRSSGEETILVALNPSGRLEEAALSADAVTRGQPQGGVPREPECLYGRSDALVRTLDGWRLRLPPVSATVIRLA
jgi:maltose alpha-D-glucosyltransferase/alpha-amylase